MKLKIPHRIWCKLSKKCQAELNAVVSQVQYTFYQDSESYKDSRHSSYYDFRYDSREDIRKCVDSSGSVYKFEQPMELSICNLSELLEKDQQKLERLFNLEKKEKELNQLKDSMKHLKNSLKDV